MWYFKCISMYVLDRVVAEKHLHYFFCASLPLLNKWLNKNV